MRLQGGPLPLLQFNHPIHPSSPDPRKPPKYGGTKPLTPEIRPKRELGLGNPVYYHTTVTRRRLILEANWGQAWEALWMGGLRKFSQRRQKKKKVAFPKNPALMYKAGRDARGHPLPVAAPLRLGLEHWRQTPQEQKFLLLKLLTDHIPENSFLSLCRFPRLGTCFLLISGSPPSNLNTDLKTLPPFAMNQSGLEEGGYGGCSGNLGKGHP